MVTKHEHAWVNCATCGTLGYCTKCHICFQCENVGWFKNG